MSYDNVVFVPESGGDAQSDATQLKFKWCWIFLLEMGFV